MRRARTFGLSGRLKAIRSLADDLSREVVRTSRGRPPVTRELADAISRIADTALKMLDKRR